MRNGKKREVAVLLAAILTAWFIVMPSALAEENELAQVEKPSEWAEEQINDAIKLNLVPTSLQSKYTQATTRAEFCALAVALYESMTDSEITARKTFDDTNDINVEKVAALGVVNGVGNNKFAPDNIVISIVFIIN